MESAYTRDYLDARANTTVQKTLNLADVKKLPIPMPPPYWRAEILGVVSPIDKAIVLLRATSTSLEEIARTIFNSWFVNFDPVQAKAEDREPDGMDAATAALFPAQFVESAQGQIPQGWTAGHLGDVCEVARVGVQKDAMLAHENYIGLEHIPRESWSLQEWGNAESLQSGKSRFVRGDILFGKLRPYFHKVCIAPFDGVCSTDILVLRTEPTWAPFVLCHLSSKALIEYATRLSNGAKMPRTKWQDLESYQIAVPPVSAARAFGNLIEPMVNKIIENVHTGKSLVELRNTLLPRLISGKLRVPDAEKQVGQVL